MGVHFDVGMFSPLLWVVFFIGVVLLFHGLLLRGCLAFLFWPFVGAAMVGVVWLYVNGFVV